MTASSGGRRSTRRMRTCSAVCGITDSLAVPGKEWAGLGKERVYLYNPNVTIEMVGLDMDGKKKNVTMFKESYFYKTIKRDKGYSWSK